MTDPQTAPASNAAPSHLQHTPFHRFHVQQGGKMVPFAGWEMPLHYGSIIEEHRHVREVGGFFDVSHMGRFKIAGRDAERFLDRVCTRQIHGMKNGQARYSLVCNEEGGCRDDVLVYRLDEGEFLMICNAANREKLLSHFSEVRGNLIFKLKDETESTAMIAIQGPAVMGAIGHFSSEVPSLKRYHFTEKSLLFAKFLISRTGYTGEDGVEVILPAKLAAQAVETLLSQAMQKAEIAIKPAGLGCRDSLRLEAGMALYGHEITEELDPISAGLHFAVKLNKGEDDPNVERFIGQDALQQIAAEGPKRTLMGLMLAGRRAARQEMKVMQNGREIGFITSGCLSPTLDKSIAMAYLDTPFAKAGERVEVDLGRASISAEVMALPFYKR